MRHGAAAKKLAALLLALTLCLGAAGAESIPLGVDNWNAGSSSNAEQWDPNGTSSGWAAADLARADAEGLISWTAKGHYQSHITRSEFAEMAVLLYLQISGRALTQDYAAAPFTDLPYPDDWVNAAYALGLVSGVSATAFAPDRTISRQEICVLFQRVLEKCGIAFPVTEPERRAALDTGSIPAWARAGVLDMVGMGVLTGTGNGYALGDKTTCEQAALLSLRVLDQARAAVNTVFTQEENAVIARQQAMRAAIEAAEVGGDIYDRAPVLAGAQDPGELNAAFLSNGLATLNYARSVAGLPGNVTLTGEKNRAAQAGALLLKAGSYSHRPSQPAGMDGALYNLGYSATSSGNIGAGYQSLAQFTLSCLDDSDPSNISRLGHRRWLLNPQLGEVGMGYVDGFCVTTVFDRSGTIAVIPDAVLWPAAGVFPRHLTSREMAWSCTPDPDKYDLAQSMDITVTMTRQSDGAVFTMRTSMSDPAQPGYFTVDTQNYGQGPTLIFRPHMEGYGHGDVYEVMITNVSLTGGGTANIEYVTKFYQ